MKKPSLIFLFAMLFLLLALMQVAKPQSTANLSSPVIHTK